MEGPIKFVAHSKFVVDLGLQLGWRPGARYTNIRDTKLINFKEIGFLDIDWKKYDFSRHLSAAEQLCPFMTVARDIESIWDLDEILKEAEVLKRHSAHVVLVPKDPLLHDRFDELLPRQYILGFSVPTKYGATSLCASNYKRPVHLLGGRPDAQLKYGKLMPVASIDCNRFTLDAAFGDYFDGEKFRPHPIGGYKNCLVDSISNINRSWVGYKAPCISPWEK